MLPPDLARDVANVAGVAGDRPVEIVPGDGVGYKCPLTQLANTLTKEGYAGDVRLSLEVADRLGNTYRRPSASTQTSGPTTKTRKKTRGRRRPAGYPILSPWRPG